MRAIFGGSDILAKFTCYLDVWLRKDARIFVRFWSRREELDLLSFELRGHSIPEKIMPDTQLDESWVPEIVRDEFDYWVRDCLDYPDG